MRLLVQQTVYTYALHIKLWIIVWYTTAGYGKYSIGVHFIMDRVS